MSFNRTIRPNNEIFPIDVTTYFLSIIFSICRMHRGTGTKLIDLVFDSLAVLVS